MYQASLHHPRHHVGPSRVDEQRELVEAGVDVVVVCHRVGHGDDHDPLPDRAVDERAGEGLVVRTVAHRTSIAIVAT
jgi:hypothetical protein